MSRSIRAALALAVTVSMAAACSEAPEPTETGPEAPEGITATNARLMLPAVAGNPGAVYFDVANASDRNMVIRAVNVQGAESAVMHTGDMEELSQVMVTPGETVNFAPGERHIMAMGLADTVVAGGQTEVTVTFVGGDKVSMPTEVRAAGDER